MVKLPDNINRFAKKTYVKTVKYGPTVGVVFGIGAGIAATVMACKATTRLEEYVAEEKKLIEEIHENQDNTDIYENEKLYKKDLSIAYGRLTYKAFKLYAPSLAVGAVSIASILYSHKVMTKRNAVLTSAYAVLNDAFKSYRERVKNELGEEMDRHFQFNTKIEECEETTTDKKGNEKVVKSSVEVVDPACSSPYAKYFDEASREWTKDPEYNLSFLMNIQREFNNKLRREGFVFLNEVYDALDIPRTKAGQIVGWIYDKDIDQKIDFGIYSNAKKPNARFVNGYENVILLDFNVDGDILSEM